jgi:aminoglycoside phosphotransferase (APT) family kinase protein
LEEDGGPLERPFFLMERIDGGTVPSPFVFDPYGEHAQALGEQFFTTLGKLAALNHEGTPIREAAPAPAPDDCWRIALDLWSGVIEADEQHPQPIVRAAIRWLYRHPPPPAQRISIVHGDYRSGNFMHDGAGTILAILDWEMAHLGDPVEDLGWAFDPLWNHFDEGKVSGLIPQAEAIALWEAASGLTVDPEALAWWSLFNAVKGQAIWTSAAKEYRDGGFADPILAISGWYTARRHDLILADRLARLEAI